MSKNENIVIFTYKELKRLWGKMDKKDKIRLFWIFSPYLLIFILVVIWIVLRFGFNMEF